MAAPVRLSFSGQTDANGNATITVNAPASLYAVGTIAASCAGNPRWTFQVGGQPVDYAGGPQVRSAALLTFPGEQISVGISGAQPTSSVVGAFSATLHQTAEAAASDYQPVPSTTAVQTISTRQALGTGVPTLVTPSDGSSSSVSLPLPVGTQAISLLINNPAIVTTLNLVGNVTNINYVQGLSLGPPFPNSTPYRFVVESAYDTVLTLTCQAPAGNVIRIWATAILDPEVTWIGNQEEIGVAVVSLPASPLPWQAPSTRVHLDVSNGIFPVTVVAGVPGQKIYIHGWELEIDSAAASRFARLYDSAAGTGTGDFATLDTVGTNPGSLTGSGGGGTLTSGAGIQVGSTALNTEFVRVTVWYSQA